MTKIIFMGTPQFSVPILEGLIEKGYDVIGVVTQPDRPKGRKKVLTPSPVKEAALAHHLPIWQPEKISGSQEMEEIIAQKPDLIITAAFGQFLPERLLEAPTYGAINVHASLLPKYRGGAPVHYAIMEGEEKTGVTIMQMVKKMDAGDILSQAEITIGDSNVGEMFERLSLLGRDLLLDTLPLYLEGKITPQPQNEEEATYSPNITREQEKMDWHRPAKELAYQVQGMNPFPVAHTTKEGQRWKIWAAKAQDKTTDKAPGTILAIAKEGLEVACGKGTVLAITELQPAGKSKMDIQSFVNGMGRNMQVGETFDV